MTFADVPWWVWALYVMGGMTVFFGAISSAAKEKEIPLEGIAIVLVLCILFWPAILIASLMETWSGRRK